MWELRPKLLQDLWRNRTHRSATSSHQPDVWRVWLEVARHDRPLWREKLAQVKIRVDAFYLHLEEIENRDTYYMTFALMWLQHLWRHRTRHAIVVWRWKCRVVISISSHFKFILLLVIYPQSVNRKNILLQRCKFCSQPNAPRAVQVLYVSWCAAANLTAIAVS